MRGVRKCHPAHAGGTRSASALSRGAASMTCSCSRPLPVRRPGKHPLDEVDGGVVRRAGIA